MYSKSVQYAATEADEPDMLRKVTGVREPKGAQKDIFM